MATDPARLIEEALQLPEEVRAALVALLLKSLDKTVDPDAEASSHGVRFTAQKSQEGL